MNYLFVLGRQPELSLAELERLYPDQPPRRIAESIALVTTEKPVDIQRIGGSSKAGIVRLELPAASWKTISRKIIDHYAAAWQGLEHKQTLGISIYGADISSRDIQSTGLQLKQTLKKHRVSLRLIPNQSTELSSAVSHHNKLGLSPNKVELLVTYGHDAVYIAESTGAQNITALARRDQGRPKRDAFVGMLPPKLALMMVNMATPPIGGRILDPFCGTGVVLQEALLDGYRVYGTDLSDKMIDYSIANLKWLHDTHHTSDDFTLHQGDATDTTWQPPVDAIVCETYLGQPFSAPPSLAKLDSVRRNCDHIISTFLKNLAPQLASGTPLCIAVPAWRDTRGNFTHLAFISKLPSLGYERVQLQSADARSLLYFREDQVVARELLILTKS